MDMPIDCVRTHMEVNLVPAVIYCNGQSDRYISQFRCLSLAWILRGQNHAYDNDLIVRYLSLRVVTDLDIETLGNNDEFDQNELRHPF